VQLRPYNSTDNDAIVALIEEIYLEYGEKLCLEGADSDLVDIETSYGPDSFCVLADAEGVWGTVAVKTHQENPGVSGLHRMYLHPDLRGTQWASKMIQWARDVARDRKSVRMEFWTDTRFDRAHAFYEKNGFKRGSTVRTKNDSWKQYQEFFFFEVYPTA